MQVSNTRVYGLEESIYASGYPMLVVTPTEEKFKKDIVDIFTMQGECKYEQKDIFKENKHFKRAFKLANTAIGSGHNNFLKGIIVQMDVKAPQYFWQQFQRYNFVDFVSSQSKMHCITKMDIKKCCMPEVNEVAISNAKDAVDYYDTGEITIDDILANISMGLELTARMTTNYLQLKTIYHQRKTHRSKQWKVFCEWIETLPYAKELIIGIKDGK